MTTNPVNEMSPLSEFQAHLIDQGHLSKHLYVKDHHFKEHAFKEVKTEQDVDDFLSALDNAPKGFSQAQGCSKAGAIRSAIENSTHKEWGKVELFKLHAAGRRRVNCSCHETGSFHQKYKD